MLELEKKRLTIKVSDVDLEDINAIRRKAAAKGEKFSRSWIVYAAFRQGLKAAEKDAMSWCKKKTRQT